jgi:P-type conjugative transfer protein TrbL
MNPTHLIDPGIVTVIQSNFLNNIEAGFGSAIAVASNLLYLFAAIELAVLGIVWALKRDVAWENLFFKIIKIGLIFFIIRNYTWLLEVILQSFAKLAGIVINNQHIAKYVFNPAKIWQYGYNIGVHMLEFAAAENASFGLSLVESLVGIGILLVFGLLGIQMIVQIVGFYLVSFGSLIMLPFGTLASGRGMFDKAVQAVLKAGLRLMVLIIIIGIAISTWDGLDLNELVNLQTFSLNQPLGMFFSALLFLYLAKYLPKVVSDAVGDLNSSFIEGGQQAATTMHVASAPHSLSGGIESMQAATVISPSSMSAGAPYEGASSTASAAAVPTPIISGQTIGIGGSTSPDSIEKASSVAKSISVNTVKKIQEAVNQAIKEKK